MTGRPINQQFKAKHARKARKLCGSFYSDHLLQLEDLIVRMTEDEKRLTSQQGQSLGLDGKGVGP